MHHPTCQAEHELVPAPLDWTRHGHWIGTGTPPPPDPARPAPSGCSGPGACVACNTDLSARLEELLAALGRLGESADLFAPVRRVAVMPRPTDWAARTATLTDRVRALAADRDRERASRQAWAAAAHQHHGQLLGLLRALRGTHHGDGDGRCPGCGLDADGEPRLVADCPVIAAIAALDPDQDLDPGQAQARPGDPAPGYLRALTRHESAVMDPGAHQ